MISDAAKQVEVEAHVLRYWEEELEIPAKRNEMGHRYYTEDDIRRFRRIKELKGQGLQLKAIRHMLKNGDLLSPMLFFEKNGGNEKGEVEMSEAEEAQGDMDMTKRHVVMVKKGEFLPVEGKTMAMQEESREQKSLRLQQLLREMIMEAVQSNNQEMCQEIKEDVLKELDYQFRLQEEREDAREEERLKMQEEHYQQLDELLRSLNKRGRKSRKIKKENAVKEAEDEQGKSKEKEKEKEKGGAKGFLRKKRSIV